MIEYVYQIITVL